MSTRQLRDRTPEGGRPNPVLLTDSGEGFDPDSILQGDIISRQLIHKDRAIGSAIRQLQVFRRLKYTGDKGVRITFGGGDFRYTSVPVNTITDLSNDARVT